MRTVRDVPRLPRRAKAAHKGDFGTVLVVAGSEGMLGAAILCATAALRAGAGLVQVALPAPLLPLLPLAVPCATTLPRRGARFAEAVDKADAIVVGPGLGQTPAVARLVRSLLLAKAPKVLDADALNVLAPLPVALGGDVVLTPHAGEAARLLATTTAAVQQDRGGALLSLCARSGAVVVLKGAGTLVGDGRRAFVNRTGNPGLATGGSGDVLAGLLGALLAQGMPPFDAARLAVHTHGAAGDRLARRLGQAGLIAGDLPLAIAEALR
ncbi:MAG: NAD(P)H-hydrate dehydratase [Planctomycetes bacterium]|nr:NAD(P)H-hydrate dehydratase [Planctomycetota bacterium]